MADSNPIKLCECGCEKPANNRFAHGHNSRGVIRNIAGRRFGRLVAVRPIASNKHKRWDWEFTCDCGKSLVLDAQLATTGNTKSCGCFRSDFMRSVKTVHGKTGSPTYQSWSNMKRRCGNSRNKAWPAYGGRGIKVCDRWLNSFENFLADMGECPPGLTIDRIDVNGHYQPSNCRWATKLTQMDNQRKTIHISYDGVTLNLRQWALRLSIHPETLRDRYHRGDAPPRLFRQT